MQVLTSFRLFGVIGLLAFIAYACAPSKSAGDQGTDQATATPEPEPEPEPKPVITTVAWDQGTALTVNCGGSPLDLASPVSVIAENISRDSLMYDVEPMSDCSGIFHRVLDSLAVRCPDQSFPDAASFRSSRGIGNWYNDQGKFIRVDNALEMSHLIKPGAVMFYSKTDPKTMQTDAFFQQGGIRHVGVVVDVQTDDNGVVTNYTLFHGRTTGKLAAKTNWHKRDNVPAYGNGRDYWIGVAPVMVDALAIADEGTGEASGEGDSSN